jgi:hypothetical protein
MDKIELENYEAEIGFALQNWDRKDHYLFGYDYFYTYSGSVKSVEQETGKPRARGYFVLEDFKKMSIFYFDLKFKSDRLSISFGKGEHDAFKYPIKFTRSSNFKNDRIIPVDPLYDVLVQRKIIFPFESTLSKKAWRALPFEEVKDINPEYL